MKIIHDGLPHVWVQSHQRGDTHVIGHWRPAPIGAGDTYSGDPNVLGAERRDEMGNAAAPFTNREDDQHYTGSV